jgi:hypothetical protein
MLIHAVDGFPTAGSTAPAILTRFVARANKWIKRLE